MVQNDPGEKSLLLEYPRFKQICSAPVRADILQDSNKPGALAHSLNKPELTDYLPAWDTLKWE
jgi:hypothetical protein